VLTLGEDEQLAYVHVKCDCYFLQCLYAWIHPVSASYRHVGGILVNLAYLLAVFFCSASTALILFKSVVIIA